MVSYGQCFRTQRTDGFKFWSRCIKFWLQKSRSKHPDENAAGREPFVSLKSRCSREARKHWWDVFVCFRISWIFLCSLASSWLAKLLSAYMYVCFDLKLLDKNWDFITINLKLQWHQANIISPLLNLFYHGEITEQAVSKLLMAMVHDKGNYIWISATLILLHKIKAFKKIQSIFTIIFQHLLLKRIPKKFDINLIPTRHLHAKTVKFAVKKKN